MTDKSTLKAGYSSFLPLFIGFGTVILLIGGFVAWSMNAQIDGAVVASGRIVVDENRQAVQHLTGGVVDRIYVQEGDTVEQDALLVTLDPTLTESELKIVEGQLFEFMARRGRLEAERDEADTINFDAELLEAGTRDSEIQRLIDGQARLFEARRETVRKAVTQLRAQQTQLENQIDGIDAQKAALERQLELIQEETETQEILLNKGLGQKSRVLALHREGARLAGLDGELTARRAAAMERVSELTIQELQLHHGRREEAITVLRDLQYSEMERAERRNVLLTQLDRMEIRAPVAGVVYDLRLFGSKSVIRPAEALLFIVPQDRPLVIAAEVDPIDVNRVFASQEVILRFPAFDMRSTPDLIGKVTGVSPDAFVNEQTGRSYYRAEIVLTKEEQAKLTADQELIPGMPAESFIRTGEHTPMAYLTRPLTRYFQRAMREEG